MLIVDDDDALRATLCDLFRDEGYTVFEAADGVAALERLRTYPEPLVVLLDWQLPRLDGLGVLQALAADAASAPPYVFFLLTATQDVITWRLRHHEVAIPPELSVTLLGKPFDVEDLLMSVALAGAQLDVDQQARRW
jgi:CheY-like chemotaxis protein